MKAFYISCAIMVVSLGLVCQAHSMGTRRDARSHRTRREIVMIERVNAFVDLTLREIRPAMIKFNMDPFHPPDQVQSSYLTTMAMSNITVYNMSTIKRNDDVTIIDDEAGRKLTTRVQLTFDELLLKSNYKTSALLIGSIGKLTVNIPELLVDFTIEVDFKDVKVTMQEFKLVSNSSTMKVRFSGNIESIIMNLVSSLVFIIVESILFTIVQGPVKKQINVLLNVANDVIHQTLNSIE